MGIIVAEVYDALIAAGVSPDSARAAASAVPPAQNIATKEDIAGLEATMGRQIARLDAKIAGLDAKLGHEIARLEAKIGHEVAGLAAKMATKDDIAGIEKQIAVLRFAVFTFGPALLAFMVKLTFFP